MNTPLAFLTLPQFVIVVIVAVLVLCPHGHFWDEFQRFIKREQE
jgi:hypothetical protein